MTSKLETTILHNQPLLLPAEREAVSALLVADDALMTHLKTELKRREKQLEDISSGVQAERTRLAQLELRLTDELKLEKPTQGLPNRLSLREAQTIAPYSTNRPTKVIRAIAIKGASPKTPLAKFRSDSTSQMPQKLSDVAQATSSEVIALKQAIQASLRVERLARMGVDVVKKQITLLEDAITMKKNGFRAIWRIPTEIWVFIFLECCKVDCQISGSGWVNIPTRIPNTMPLTISAICQSWRYMAMSYAELWRNIPIVWGRIKTLNTSRIRHYQLLSGVRGQTLFIFARPNDYAKERTLPAIFKEQSHVDRIICVLGYSQCTVVNKFLEGLPATRELWVVRDPQYPSIPSVFIPLHHCLSITKALTFQCRINWADGQKLHLTEYTAITPDVIVRTPDEAIPGSLPTLRIMHIDSKSFSEHEPANRQTLQVLIFKSNIRFFALSFVRRYQLPRLQTLEIVSPSSISTPEWNATQAYFDFAQIQEIKCASMYEHVQELALRTLDFISLKTLDLQGGCVDPILSYLVKHGKSGGRLFPQLNRLIINSYEGGGTSILSFLQYYEAIRQTGLSGGALMPELQLLKCTRISLYIHSKLRAFMEHKL
jgi:hypothetical protein